MVNNKTLIIVLIIFVFLSRAHNQTMVDMKLTGHTNFTNNHQHIYYVDEFGDGQTSLTDGHFHYIHYYIVLEEEGHTHTLER